MRGVRWAKGGCQCLIGTGLRWRRLCVKGKSGIEELWKKKGGEVVVWGLPLLSCRVVLAVRALVRFNLTFSLLFLHTCPAGCGGSGRRGRAGRHGGSGVRDEGQFQRCTSRPSPDPVV